MTTKQNPNVSKLDVDLDQASGGLIRKIGVPATLAHEWEEGIVSRMKELAIWSELGKTGVLRVDKEHKDWITWNYH